VFCSTRTNLEEFKDSRIFLDHDVCGVSTIVQDHVRLPVFSAATKQKAFHVTRQKKIIQPPSRSEKYCRYNHCSGAGKFLGLPDPEPEFFELTRILPSARQKILRKTLISFVFVTS
jgi:hypothetical protein